MSRSALILAGLLIVSGSIFVGQGLGILQGSSFMVGDITWSWIGAGLIVIGIAIVVLVRRRGNRPA